jgi:phosphate transport system substrate-binding protein
MRLRGAIVLIGLVSTLGLVACGGDDDGGGSSASIGADGSSTVAPLATAAAERFQQDNPDARITVGVAGTGGGFERFCRGETDLSNASRPIDEDEMAACAEQNIEYTQLQVANDALTVVVNAENDWAECLTVEQLKKIWEPNSQVDSWNDVDPSFPDEQIQLYGPGTDSGTFDYFTDEINGEEGASRSDYSASEDDNVLVRGVMGETGALGYFGFSYFEENQDSLKAVSINSGDGCVAPSADTAQSGEYKPLARPLFTYVKTASLEKEGVRDFLTFWLDNAVEITEQARFVPMTDQQLEKSRSDLEAA